MGVLANSTMTSVIMNAMQQTLYMVFWSTLFSVLIGFIPAIILTLTAPDGLHPIRPVYEVLSFVINVFRSFPFIILLVLVIPFTRMMGATDARHYTNAGAPIAMIGIVGDGAHKVQKGMTINPAPEG